MKIEMIRKKLSNSLLFAAIMYILFSVSLVAQEQSFTSGKSYGSFMFFDDVPNTLFFAAEIAENDSFEFRKAIRNHDIDTIVLSSRGGSVWEGLNIAGMIFDKKLTTYVPKTDTCASACAFMFFAGDTRKSLGKLGVHQFFTLQEGKSVGAGISEAGSQFTVSQIIGFLNEFETPPFVYEKMFSQKDMYFFSEAELVKINRLEEPENLERFKVIETFLLKVDAFLEAQEKKKAQKDAPKPEVPATIIKAPEKQIKKQETSAPEPVKEKDELEVSKLVQTEFNRIGCKLGKVDGIIGPRSKSALERFNKINKSNFTQDDFHSNSLLNDLKTKEKNFCPKVKDSKKQAQFEKWKGSMVCTHLDPTIWNAIYVKIIDKNNVIIDGHSSYPAHLVRIRGNLFVGKSKPGSVTYEMRLNDAMTHIKGFSDTTSATLKLAARIFGFGARTRCDLEYSKN